MSLPQHLFAIIYTYTHTHVYFGAGGFHASIFGGTVVYGTYASAEPDLFSVCSAIHLYCGRRPSRSGGRSVYNTHTRANVVSIHDQQSQEHSRLPCSASNRTSRPESWRHRTRALRGRPRSPSDFGHKSSTDSRSTCCRTCPGRPGDPVSGRRCCGGRNKCTIITSATTSSNDAKPKQTAFVRLRNDAASRLCNWFEDFDWLPADKLGRTVLTGTGAGNWHGCRHSGGQSPRT